MVKNFSEWIAAVKTEWRKLHDVQDYLNDEGTQRHAVFAQLKDMACFCATASELVEWIDSREGLTNRENTLLNDHHAETPIYRLRAIAGYEASTDPGAKS